MDLGWGPVWSPLPASTVPTTSTMDAIRKKMQSLKGETDSLYSTIAGFEEQTREAAGRADQVTGKM